MAARNMAATSLPAPLLPDPAFPAGLGAARATPEAPGGGPLAKALRHALRDAAGRVVLRIERVAPHRLKVARALLQEGALAAGGQVLDGPAGDLLLVGAEARRADRLRALLESLVGPAGALLWSLERDAETVLAYAAGGAAAAPRPAQEGPSLAGLDGFLDSLPLPPLLHRLHGLAPGGAPAFLRLEPSRAAIAAALGPLGEDADLLDHAMRRIGLRLLGALADRHEGPALLGKTRLLRLHLPLPAEACPVPAEAPNPAGLVVATLPLAAAAEPEALSARRAGLAAAGIGLELDGLEAPALALLDPAALPDCLLRLRWSPALAAAAPSAALRRVDPARLILAGASGPEAMRFAAALGLGFVEQPAP